MKIKSTFSIIEIEVFEQQKNKKTNKLLYHIARQNLCAIDKQTINYNENDYQKF